MATTPLGFARKMDGLANRVPAGLPRATVRAGEHVARTVRSIAPARLRNVGKNGARIGVRVLPPKRTGSEASAAVRATGPFHLVEHTLSAHTIIPRSTGRGAKGRGSKRANRESLYAALFGGGGGYGSPAVRLPDGSFRHAVQHPGVRNPSRPFARGVTVAAPNTSRIYHESIVDDIRAALR